jgi:hypothetical protein
MRALLCLAVFALSAATHGQERIDPQPKKAQDLLDDAIKEAKEKKKRVLLTFGSPG